jgi:hypothetical protein
MYSIEMLAPNDVNKFQNFVGLFWQKDHIFTRDKSFLKWQHYNEAKKRYNFLVAKNDDQDIDAIFGFIPVAHFGDAEKTADFWLALWMRKDGAPDKSIGLKLLERFEKIYQPETMGVIGFNDVAMNIFKMLGFKVGALSHYYIHNSNKTEFQILAGTPIDSRKDSGQKITSIRPLTLAELTESLNSCVHIDPMFRPVKTANYFLQRYSCHPSYQYIFLGSFYLGDIINIYICRKEFVGDSSSLKILDIVGELAPLSIRHAMIKYLEEINAEFVDCYNFGIPKDLLEAVGFSEADETVTIPNYFHPFVRKNIELRYAYKTSAGYQYTLFRGDSDQDRPS